MNDLGMAEHPDVYTAQEHPEITRKYLNIRYAERTSAEYLDIYLPEEGDGPFPVIIDMHGGGWIYGVKSSVRMYPVLEGLKKGYAVVSLAYTLSGDGVFPVQIYDVKAAVRYLRGNARRYCLDAGRIGLWGLSAGAYLAALAGATNGVEAMEDKSMGYEGFPSDVEAVVALYAPVNLAACQLERNRADGYDSPEGRLLGKDPLEDPEWIKFADPATYVGSRVPPFFLQYGDADQLVSPDQGKYLVRALKPWLREDQIFFEVIHGAEHADDKFRTKENTEKIFRFLDRHLKGIHNQKQEEESL